MHSAPAHFVFVDFENVSDVDLALVAGKPAHVTLLIGKNQKKLDVSLVKQIHQFAAQVELIELTGSGRNALDMTLAYYLGRAAQREPEARFYVVSKDRDFEPMLAHVAAAGVKASRVDAFAEVACFDRPKKSAVVAAPAKKIAKPAAKKILVVAEKDAAAPEIAQKPKLDRRAKVLDFLRSPNSANRPTKLKALMATIKNGLGKGTTEVEAENLAQVLLAEKSLSIELNGKVNYRS